METGVALVGLVIVLITVLPFIWMREMRRRKEKARWQQLQLGAREKGIDIQEYAFCGPWIFALHAEAKYFFYAHESAPGNVQMIGLNDVKRCELVKSMESQGSRISDIALKFHFRSQAAPITIPTYSSDKSSQLSDELMTTGQWEKKIMGLL